MMNKKQTLRIKEHPILGDLNQEKTIEIVVDGEPVKALEGESIASALMASGKRIFRYSNKHKEPRGVYCAIGRCTDCIMKVDGQPNVRTCVTTVREGMVIETQVGLGTWEIPTNGKEG
jgi:predicted molibdopterin-dependent oxidoreductase YjgC